MTVRNVTTGAGEYDLAENQLFTDYERELFTRVVTLAEKEGKTVDLLVVPAVDPFDDVTPYERASLETEAPSRRLVAQGLVADDLEGHLSLEARVLGPVHDPHPALAEALDDPVSTECGVHGVPGGTMAQHPIRKTKPPRKS